jgi:Mg-chelatase subunit ChlD
MVFRRPAGRVRDIPGWMIVACILLGGTVEGIAQTAQTAQDRGKDWGPDQGAANRPAPGGAPRTLQDPNQEVIKIGTNLVTVPVVVTDPYGRFARGLEQLDFTVREDGVSQKIENFSAEESAFDVALLIDSSRSTQNVLNTIRKAAISFFRQLQPRDRVMIVTFDEKVRFINDFTNNPAELERAVKNIRTGYLTSLYDAIDKTINEKLVQARGRKALVILTDGVDTASKKATFESTLELIAQTGIIAYAIHYETRNDGGRLMKPLSLPPPGGAGFAASFAPVAVPQASEASASARAQAAGLPVSGQGAQDPAPTPRPIINLPAPTQMPTPRPSTPSGPETTSPVAPQRAEPGSRPSSRVNSQPKQTLRDRELVAIDYLRSLAVQSGARFIRAENVENTSFAFRLIAEELRYQYTLSYISNNEKQDGGYRSIAVQVGRPGLLVRARLGYRAPVTP